MDILYRGGDNLTDPIRQHCRLDLYHPAGSGDFSTLVWFHGGGLTGGHREFPPALLNQGIAVVAVDYRLSPDVKAPVWIEDAAAAVAWVFRNIETRGGSRKRIFVGGHSAGGYLTTMVGLDRRWLAAEEIDANEIAGLVSCSGHAITHFTVRGERGIDRRQPVVDGLAPLFHVRGDAPPLLLLTGDRDLEMLGRYEETAYFWRMMKVAGHSRTELIELEGLDHGQMLEPALQRLLKFIADTDRETPRGRD